MIILILYVLGPPILFLRAGFIHTFHTFHTIFTPSLRVWDAGSCMIMNNLSELVVRQLEKDIARKVGGCGWGWGPS